MNLFRNIKYLGVRIDYEINSSNFENAFSTIFKKGDSKIYTINPEFIVDSYFNSDFKKELNSSDLNVIDGVGLLYGIKKYFKDKISKNDFKSLETFTGVDLVDKILEISNERKLSLFLLGGSKESQVSKKASERIKKLYPEINLVGYSSEFSFEEIDDKQTLEFIKKCMKKSDVEEVDILLVGYGHVKQELWIGRNSKLIPSRVSVGVGGTLDYLSGNIKRAPKFIRGLGLEWFYRLITQPNRILRILKATVIFSYLSNVMIKKNFSKN